MKIGMTLPVMEPDLSRQDLEDWTLRIDAGPWSHIALGERILFPNPEFIATLSAVAAWTKRVEIIATISVLTMHNPMLMSLCLLLRVYLAMGEQALQRHPLI